MYYKEWSTDSFWLPEAGICILPEQYPVPTCEPREIQPLFDAEVLSKVETTLKKISAYLERDGACSWWEAWLENAKKLTHSQDAKLTGLLIFACLHFVFVTHIM